MTAVDRQLPVAAAACGNSWAATAGTERSQWKTTAAAAPARLTVELVYRTVQRRMVSSCCQRCEHLHSYGWVPRFSSQTYIPAGCDSCIGCLMKGCRLPVRQLGQLTVAQLSCFALLKNKRGGLTSFPLPNWLEALTKRATHDFRMQRYGQVLGGIFVACCSAVAQLCRHR